MRGSRGLLVCDSRSAAIGCQSRAAGYATRSCARAGASAGDRAMWTDCQRRLRSTAQARRLPRPARLTRRPSGSFSYNGGQLTPVTPPPSDRAAAGRGDSCRPLRCAADAHVPAPAYQTPTYQPPAGTALRHCRRRPTRPLTRRRAEAGHRPVPSTDRPRPRSITARTMQRELRRWAKPRGRVCFQPRPTWAATDARWRRRRARARPGRQDIANAHGGSACTMRRRHARSSRFPITFPQGAPPRTIRGAVCRALSIPPTNPAASPRGDRPQRQWTGRSAAATYGFDANYAWLQGQLEYSDATKQWKLRYVPINGPTDRYGGSVVLGPTPALAGYKAGDFVSVKGQVASGSTGQGSYRATVSSLGGRSLVRLTSPAVGLSFLRARTGTVSISDR